MKQLCIDEICHRTSSLWVCTNGSLRYRLQWYEQVTENPDAVDIAIVSGEVNFSALSFTYGDDRHPVLNDLNLHIRAGETVALVGPSGGGKTTLAKLLLRLYEPLCGEL